MGFFSKKPKAPQIDLAVSAEHKKRLRQIFDETVEDGAAFQILYGYSTSTKFERGFVLDSTTTTFYEYIIGYRADDRQVVLVQIAPDLTRHSEAFYLEMEKIVNVSYDPKLCQTCLQYVKGYDRYGEILNIKDCSGKAVLGVANLEQGAEREAFLDFLEGFRAELAAKGYKLDKWRR